MSPALAHNSQRTTRERGVVVNLEGVAPPPTRIDTIKEHLKKHEDWMEKNRDALLIAATVIAGMSYQAGLNPPGGVWQGNSDSNQTKPYHAGESVLAHSKLWNFHAFWISNTVSFVASLSIIFLLLSGIPVKRRFFMWILMVIAWVTITFMTLTYCTSVLAISPLHNDNFDWTVIYVISGTFLVWLGLLGIVLLVHIVRFIIWSVRKVFKLGKWLFTSVTCDRGNV